MIVPAQYSDDLSELDEQREIEAAKQEIRQLLGKGKYREVIIKCDVLEKMDPGNSSAIIWKKYAEEQTFVPATPIPIYKTPDVDDKDIVTPSPTATPRPTSTPVPPPDGGWDDPTGGTTDNIDLKLIMGLVVGVLFCAAIAIVAWLRVRATRAKLAQAISRAQKANDDPTFSDMPTAVSLNDEVTQVQGTYEKPWPKPDDDSVVQYGSVGKGTPSLQDADTMDMMAGGGDMKFGGDVPEDQVTAVGGSYDDQTRQGDAGYNEYDPNTGLGLYDENTGGDVPALRFASANAPLSEHTDVGEMPPPPGTGEDQHDSQTLDLSEDERTRQEMNKKLADSREKDKKKVVDADPDSVSFNSLMFANRGETPKPSGSVRGQEVDADPDSISFNSLMFSGQNDTQPIGPAGTGGGVEAEDPNAMSFNSLMFAGGDETRESNAPPADTGVPSAPPPEEPEDPNAMSFNSLMFASGGNDTIASGASSPNKDAAGGDSGEATLMLSGSNENNDDDQGGFDDLVTLEGGIGDGQDDDALNLGDTIQLSGGMDETVQLFDNDANDKKS